MNSTSFAHALDCLEIKQFSERRTVFSPKMISKLHKLHSFLGLLGHYDMINNMKGVGGRIT